MARARALCPTERLPTLCCSRRAAGLRASGELSPSDGPLACSEEQCAASGLAPERGDQGPLPPGVEQAAALGAPKGGHRPFTVLHLNPRNPALHEKHTKEDPVRSMTSKVLLRGIYDHRDEPLPVQGRGISCSFPPGHVCPHAGICFAFSLAKPNQTTRTTRHAWEAW